MQFGFLYRLWSCTFVYFTAFKLRSDLDYGFYYRIIGFLFSSFADLRAGRFYGFGIYAILFYCLVGMFSCYGITILGMCLVGRASLFRLFIRASSSRLLSSIFQFLQILFLDLDGGSFFLIVGMVLECFLAKCVLQERDYCLRDCILRYYFSLIVGGVYVDGGGGASASTAISMEGGRAIIYYGFLRSSSIRILSSGYSLLCRDVFCDLYYVDFPDLYRGYVGVDYF